MPPFWQTPVISSLSFSRILTLKTDTMNKTDLRLGNLVEYPGWNKDGTSAYFKVRDIFWEDDKLALTNGIIQLPQTRLEYIRPIPLSPEWLERFGLNYLQNACWELGSMRIYNLSDEENSRFRITLAGNELVIVSYVHQFQNFYHAISFKDLSVSV
jgi:hypothetical protein